MIETDDIDFKAVTAQLQNENERLRMMLFEVRHNNPSLFDLRTVWDSVKHNYMQIYVFVLLGWVLVSFMQTIISLFKGVSNA